MSKEAYYFSHDSNARNDDKILELRASHGFEGYGIYWAIVEVLREQTDYQFRSNALAVLSIALSCEKTLLEDVVTTCLEIGLFVEENGYFFSESLKRRMQKYEEKRAKRVAAGQKGGKSKANAKAMLDVCSSKNVANKGKENKGKENKEKEDAPFTPPSAEEVMDYFEANGYNRDTGRIAWQYYNAYDWRDKDGKKVKSWKQKMIAVWFKPEHKSEAQIRKMVY